MSLVALILAALVTTGTLLWWRRGLRARRAAFVANYPYARHLDFRLAQRRPELTGEQRAQVFAGLVDYFQLCQQAGRRMVAMPSQAVDEAWHEFILFTRNYERFCRQAFGRFLHHTPAVAMTSPTQASDGLKRAWRLACAREGIDPRQPQRLPRLFALDAALGISGGFIYQLDCLAAGQTGTGYCASHMGCTSCAGDSQGSDAGSGDGDGGGGCGGD